MGIFKVEISGALIVEGLKTGGRINVEISKGIPADSRLINACLHRLPMPVGVEGMPEVLLEMEFSSEKTPGYSRDPMSIEVVDRSERPKEGMNHASKE